MRVIRLLTSSGCQCPVPVHGALEEVDDALEQQDVLALHRALQDPVLALRCLQRDNLQRYLEQLSMEREQKALVGAGGAWGVFGCWSPGDPIGDQHLRARGPSVVAPSAQTGSVGHRSSCCRSWAMWTCWSRKSWKLGSSRQTGRARRSEPVSSWGGRGAFGAGSGAGGEVLLPGASLWSRCLPAVLGAISRINAAIRHGNPAETLGALMEPAAQLPDVYPLAAPLYQHQLALLQSQHPRVSSPWMRSGSHWSFGGGSIPLIGWVMGVSVSLPCPMQGELVQEELFVAVEMLSAVALVNRALDAGDPDALWSSLVSSALGLAGVEDANGQR